MYDVSYQNLENSLNGLLRNINYPGLFDERQRRICCGLLALHMGTNGIPYVSEISDLDQRTIKRGITEIKAGQIVREDGRIREIGGGRQSVTEIHPELLPIVEEILEDATYGSPENELLYKNISLSIITDELNELGYTICKNTVGTIITKLNYSKQQNQKLLLVGEPHPRREEILNYTFSMKNEYETNDLPCISIDAKNKVNIGNYKNPGQEYLKKGCPRPVTDHDFPQEGKLIPYGGFIPNINCGMIILNTSSDTAQLAVSSLQIFYEELVIPNFGYVREILVICDGGGSNGRLVRLFKYELALMAEELGITIHVCHLPPGESKFNMIEHRMFNHISRNWAAKPIMNIDVAKHYIENTTTRKGLKVNCHIDNSIYKKGIKVSDQDFNNIDIEYVGPVAGFSYKIKGMKHDSEISCS